MGLIGNMSVKDNNVLKATELSGVLQCQGLLSEEKGHPDYALKMQEKYDIRCTSVEQETRNLSGGNQQEVDLARELEGSRTSWWPSTPPGAWISAPPASPRHP